MVNQEIYYRRNYVILDENKTYMYPWQYILIQSMLLFLALFFDC